MPYIDIDIDVDDFYYELSRREKQELITYLKQDGLLDEQRLVEFDSSDSSEGSVLDHEWVDMLNKINQARYQLTSEQEKLLFNLAKQL
jgi:hypothetical protein